MEPTRIDASLEVRKLAGSLGVRWPMYTEALMVDRMIDIAKSTESSLEKVHELMVYRWNEYRKAMPSLNYPKRSPESFLCCFYWDSPKEWPWREAKTFEPGIEKTNPHTKEFVEWRDQWREEHGLPKL